MTIPSNLLPGDMHISITDLVCAPEVNYHPTSHKIKWVSLYSAVSWEKRNKNDVAIVLLPSKEVFIL